MSARTEVLLWAQRVIGRKGATPHQILELSPGASPDDARDAFHKVARMAHPDLHRRTLDPAELELITTAYARAAAAYQEIRGLRMSTGRIRTIRDGDLAASSPAVASKPATAPSPGTAAPRSKPATALVPDTAAAPRGKPATVPSPSTAAAPRGKPATVPSPSTAAAPRGKPATIPADCSLAALPDRPAAASEEPASIGPKMSARALLHYRRAELALSRGDLSGAVLLLKMAVASDPQSVFLRSALSEVEAEVAKKL